MIYNVSICELIIMIGMNVVVRGITISHEVAGHNILTNDIYVNHYGVQHCVTRMLTLPLCYSL
jgi:hypothetical protein